MAHLTTQSGRKFDFDRPVFHLPDVAHALSRMIRYNGHQTGTWSVAQHSIACSFIVGPSFSREALLHDACEAYLCDVPTPLKMILPGYQALEHRIESHMRMQFCLPPEMSGTVKQADRDMLIAETQLFHPPLWKEMGSPTPNPLCIQAIQAIAGRNKDDIRELFMSRAVGI